MHKSSDDWQKNPPAPGLKPQYPSNSAAKRNVEMNNGVVTKSKGILGDSDFEVIKAPKLQANILLFADAGCGKSTFATQYAPDPVAMINYDRRADHAVVKSTNSGRKVYMCRVDFPANITKLADDQARKIGQTALDKTVKNFEWAVRESQKGNVRSICLDTATELSEIMKLAITGRIDRTKGDYGRSKDLINREWWRLFNMAREGEAHLVVLSRAKAIWVNNEPTGRFTYRAPEVVNDAVDWAAQIRLKKQVGKKPKKEFEMEVTKAGINIAELGEVYSKEEWEDLGGPFVYGCLLQYEGSSPEDWV